MWDEQTGEIIVSDSGTQIAHEQHFAFGNARQEESSTLGLLLQAAQGIVREPKALIERSKQIGGLLGSDGFYSFPTGKSLVEGPSIDMAQALANEWGAIIYQVRVVHVEPMASGGQRVHLRASVSDLRSIVCVEVDQVVSTTPPPGGFASKADQQERWHSMQMQSAASKIVRNAILRILPSWYVEPAFQAAKSVNSKRALNGKTLAEARKGAADALKNLGCSLQELETFLAQPIDLWAVPQISALRELFASLNSGTQSIEAWRQGLSDKAPAAGNAPRRSALGLSSTSESKPLDVPPAAEPAKEPAKRGKAEKPADDTKPADLPAEVFGDREPGSDDKP